MPHAKQISDTTYRVLLIDDHEVFRASVRELLSAGGRFQVCGEAMDPSQALSLLEREAPDILILDLSLERGDGLSLTHQVRAHYPELPILILSMHQEELFAERALRAGANGYMMKSDLGSNLPKAMEQVMAGRVYVSPVVHNMILNKLRGSDTMNQEETIRQLSDRELEIFNLFGQGCSPQDLAERLELSVKTIETHRSHIKKKLGFKTNQQLSEQAREWARKDSQPVLAH